MHWHQFDGHVAAQVSVVAHEHLSKTPGAELLAHTPVHRSMMNCSVLWTDKTMVSSSTAWQKWLYSLSQLPLVLRHCSLGARKSIWPVKIEWWDVGAVICLEQETNCLHIVQLMPLPSQNPIISCQTGSTFLVPAYPGCPEKQAVK